MGLLWSATLRSVDRTLTQGPNPSCAELALPVRLLALAMSQLSGGQAAKAALATLLLSRFDIVLLDEPTNDLDFDGLERLEGFLDRRQGGLVVVSHDRAFLKRIVTSVGEIDPGTHGLTLYQGGWRSYLQSRATARRHASEAHLSYVAERERLASRARQQRQWAVAGVAKAVKGPKDNDKAQRDFRINRTEKQASKVRATERAIERLEEVDKPYEPWQLHLEIAAAPRSGDRVATLEAAVVRREPGASARSTWSSDGVTASGSWVETVQARRPSWRWSSGPCRSKREVASLARASCSASSARPGCGSLRPRCS